MKEYVLTKLNDTINPETSVKEWLSAMDLGDDTLDDEAWFTDHFPAALEHKNVVPAYVFLENALNASRA